MERAALTAFYHATGGLNWEEDEGWRSVAPPDQWHGVVTDSNGRVAELRLANNQLTGRIPPKLGDLSNLTAPGLKWNQLMGGCRTSCGTSPTWLSWTCLTTNLVARLRPHWATFQIQDSLKRHSCRVRTDGPTGTSQVRFSGLRRVWQRCYTGTQRRIAPAARGCSMTSPE